MYINYIAIENQTRIAFVLRRASGYFGIDDGSIRDTAAPTIELLSNGGFETGNFFSWTHCVQSGSPATGSVQSTSSSGVTRVGHGWAPPNHWAVSPNQLFELCQLSCLVRPTTPQTTLTAAQPPDI
jgi:hypothetical protein